MELVWRISPKDVAAVRLFYKQQQQNPFVQKRIATNLRTKKAAVTKEEFWTVMVGCLLTTQQRSGPDSAVSRLLLTTPFPLSHDVCCKKKDLAGFVTKILSDFGGLRRTMNIGKELAANDAFLQHGGWEITVAHLDAVRRESTPKTERIAAEFIDDHFAGFGPKQSRNLLQGLGLSRHEVPSEKACNVKHYYGLIRMESHSIRLDVGRNACKGNQTWK
jgi:hypothetical protein